MEKCNTIMAEQPSLDYANAEILRRDFHYFVFNKLVWKQPLNDRNRKIFALWKEKFNPNMTFFEHYKDKRVLYEIVKHLGNSELCINENIRWLYSAKIEYLLHIIYFYRVLEYEGKNKKGDKISGLSFYKGLSNFSNRESPPFSPKEKKEWQDNYWTRKSNPEYIKKINGYNFGLDVDGKNFEDSYKDSRMLFNFFKKFNLKFSTWCSGKKGFNFLVPYEEFKELVEPFDLDYTIVFCKSLMLDLVKYLKLKKVDTLIYSSSRYLKCSWTIDARNGRIILPLNDEEFLDFPNNPDKYFSLEYCHSLPNLGYIDEYRGRESNKRGFAEMIKFLEEKL